MLNHDSGPRSTATPLGDSVVPVEPVHASGTVDALSVKEGADLDAGQRRDQETPGVDVSFGGGMNRSGQRVRPL